jgi:dienelactone hydrolase
MWRLIGFAHGRWTIGAAALVSLLSMGTHAGAQSWLAQVGAPALGPDRANGVVVWSHGRSIESEDYLAPLPPYVGFLAKRGWDAYRFNRLRDRDTLPDSARALGEAASALKTKGYRRVVLAGQSFGAFLSIIAAGRSDDVDAVIATAPAAYGSFAEYYETWRLNASKLYPLLEQMSSGTRVMLFFFHGDDFDPGGRGERASQILDRRAVEHRVIDQPARLVGHWAATTPAFADRFGSCMLAFIEGRDGGGVLGCDGYQGPTALERLASPVTTASVEPSRTSAGPTGGEGPN